MKFHHLGIIVKNLKKSLIQLENLLGSNKISKVIIDKTWGVKIVFIQNKKNMIFEIIQPLNKKSPITNALNKNVNILNHVAFKSRNFRIDRNKIIDNGAIAVTEAKKAVAFNRKKIQFFLTKENFLIELIEI